MFTFSTASRSPGILSRLWEMLTTDVAPPALVDRRQAARGPAIAPSLPIHPQLASTAHLGMLEACALPRMTWQLGDLDGTSVLVAPGKALGREYMDLLHTTGAAIVTAETVERAAAKLAATPRCWSALVLDVEALGGAALCRSLIAKAQSGARQISIVCIASSQRQSPDLADMVLRRPFSLQQLEVALDAISQRQAFPAWVA